MMLDTPKKQGVPNWVDCATLELEPAETFYAAVFGWTSEHMVAPDGRTYSIQKLDGNMVAAIYELNEGMRSARVPPHWATYFVVNDVDATVALVKAEGGAVVIAPFDDPVVGRMAIIRDSTGGHVRLWHATPLTGAEVFNVAGALTWSELMTGEPEKAADFYEKVLGVDTETSEDPMPYTTLGVEGRPVAGILKLTPEMGDMPPSWDVYFASDDVDETVAKVKSAGGTALREAFEIPNVGRMAVLQDPFGAVFEVIHMSMVGN